MDVHELAPGEAAPQGADRITLKALPDGRFGYEATHTTNDVTHESTFEETYEAEDHALKAALAWAELTQIKALYVERPNT